MKKTTSHCTIAIWLACLLLSAALAEAQNPCPTGSSPSSAAVAAKPAAAGVTSTAAPMPATAAPKPGIATPSPGIAAPHPRAANPTPHTAAPQPMTASSIANMSSASAPKVSPGGTPTRAMLSRPQPPCSPSSGAPEASPTAASPN